MILPHLDYCDLVYMCMTEANLQKLQQIQNCACRIILRADNETSAMLMHQELDLLTLKQCQILQLAMDCFTNVNNKDAGQHKFFIPLDTNRARTTCRTNTNKMQIENIRTVMGRKAYMYRRLQFWNTLVQENRLIDNKATFKNHITNLLCRDINHPG